MRTTALIATVLATICAASLGGTAILHATSPAGVSPRPARLVGFTRVLQWAGTEGRLMLYARTSTGCRELDFEVDTFRATTRLDRCNGVHHPGSGVTREYSLTQTLEIGDMLDISSLSGSYSESYPCPSGGCGFAGGGFGGDTGISRYDVELIEIKPDRISYLDWSGGLGLGNKQLDFYRTEDACMTASFPNELIDEWVLSDEECVEMACTRFNWRDCASTR